MSSSNTKAVLREALRRPVAFNPMLARIAGGNVCAGLFLSQALYWSERTGPDGWFYKTAAEWEEETCLSRHEQDGARDRLKRLGFLDDEVRCQPGANRPMVHFRVNVEAVLDAMDTFAEKRQMQMPKSGKCNSRKPANANAADRQMQMPKSGKPYKEAESTTESTSKSTGSSGAGAPAASANGKPPHGQGMKQSERDSWDLRRLRTEMDKLETPAAIGAHSGDPEEAYLDRVRRAAYLAGVTLERAQELLKQFFPNDPVLDRITRQKSLGLEETA